MADNDQRRRRRRADELLPEERTVGSDDPERQADAILADSDERELHSREATTPVEHRHSDGTDAPA